MSSGCTRLVGGMAIMTTLLCRPPEFVSGQEISVVVPNWLEDTEGNSPFAEGTSSFHSQILYHVDEFASLPATHHNLVATAWRMHSRTPAPVSGSFADLRITFSTTVVTALSPDFEANHGPDKTVVFDGRREFSGEPGEFVTPILFDEPFFFDPRLAATCCLISLHGLVLTPTIGWTISRQTPLRS